MKDDKERKLFLLSREEKRIHYFAILIVIATLIFWGRLFQIQVLDRGHYSVLAKNQYLRPFFDSFDRGGIFMKSGKSYASLAEMASTYDISVNPTQLSDADIVLLRAYLKEKNIYSQELFESRVMRKSDPYEIIGVNLTEDQVKGLDVKKYNLTTVTKNNRVYPAEDIASKVVGFVGDDGRGARGLYGVERYYNEELNRDDGGVRVNFFAELFSDIKQNEISNSDRKHGDIYLTIEDKVERMLHNELLRAKESWKSETIGGIVMDPQTGSILAMEVVPGFNPNSFSKVADTKIFSNEMVSGVYEMGSILKPITMASALDSGAVTLESTYIDSGFRELDGYKVRNFDGKARGLTTLQTILDKSLNVGIVFLVESLGVWRFQEYFKEFGLAKETGVDLPGEASGLSNSLDSKVFVDSATAGFGQGIALTPIQTVRALAVLGNGGKLVTPHVLDKIVFEDGSVKQWEEGEQKQIIKEETSEMISRMLVHVVDNALKDGAYKMPYYSIAAKTGTAQMPKPGGGYYEDRYLHSLFGYFPAYDPKYIIFLFHTHPKGAEYASATLTDPFFNIVKFLISYYQVPPDRSPPEKNR
jgi:cell division protein FtsI/penicillin-binding protein 2